jgi:hypothetical protein
VFDVVPQLQWRIPEHVSVFPSAVHILVHQL